MNKNGIVRIIEATLAIVIIASALFFFFNQQRAQEVTEEDLTNTARIMLEELSRDQGLRQAVLDASSENNGRYQEAVEKLNNFFNEKTSQSDLQYKYRVCRVGEACGVEYREGQVYSAERTISSTLDDLGPFKIRLFIWRGENNDQGLG